MPLVAAGMPLLQKCYAPLTPVVGGVNGCIVNPNIAGWVTRWGR